jgi:hypothetical protein
VSRSFDDVKKLASRPTATVSLCLAGELFERHAQLVRQLEDAAPAASVGEASPKRVIAEQIVALEEEMREATVDFHLRAKPSREWGVLFADQPQRKKENSEEWAESAEEWEPRWFAWQARMVSATCVDPEMDVEQVGELVDLVNYRAWGELATKAYILNMGEVDVPNSEAASELIGISD